MSEVVRCGKCGSRYDGRHQKCPRCRSRDRRRLGSSAAEASGVRVPLPILGGSALLMAVLAAALIWAVQPGDIVPPPQEGGNGPLAALVRAAPSRATMPERVPGEVPFLDPAAEGRIAYQHGDYDEALQHFEEEIARRPTDPEAHNNAGQVLVRLGRPAEAVPYLAKAVALDPERWAYRFNLARGHGALGHWNLAAAEYEEAARVMPGDYATLFNLAQALHRAGREDEAVARYHEAIDLQPDDPTFHLALAVSEEKRTRLPEAVAAYRRYLEMDPQAKDAPGVRARADRLETAAAAAAPVPPAAVRPAGS